MDEASRPACRVVTAATIGRKFLEEVSEDLSKLGRGPLLVGFLANNDPAARMYADWTQKTCAEK